MMTDILGYSVLLAMLLCATSFLFAWPVGRAKGLKVFGTGLIGAFVLFAIVFNDFDAGALAFQNEDWADAVQALERVETGAPQYDSAQALLRLARYKLGAPMARATDSAATANNPPTGEQRHAPDTPSDVGTPEQAPAPRSHTQAAADGTRYALSNDGRQVYVSSSRDWWDDAHFRAVVPSGTQAVLLKRERIEDVPGFVIERCRVQTTGGTRVAGWVFCTDLHAK
jgi:hypothetical protein